MASIDDQIREVRKLVEKYDLNIVDVIQESKSAKEPGRPLFNQMLHRIHKGEADGILTWKLNRLARNPVDGGQISWMLQQNIIKHIQTFEREYYPTDNVLLMQVEFGMANQYIKDLSLDVKRGMRQKAERGWYPIPLLPVGYMHNPRIVPGGDNEIIPDLEKFEMVKKIWQFFLTGEYSIVSIKKKGDVIGLRNRYNRPMSKSTYHFILTNEFYSGYFHWKDKDGSIIRYKGKHKPIISSVDFQRVQRILNEKTYPLSKEKKYDFPYRGLIKCSECGCYATPDHKLQAICTNCKCKFSIKTVNACPKCNMALSEMKNPSIIDIVYYHCSKSKGKCSQGSVTRLQIESAIEKSLKEISITKNCFKWIMNNFKGNSIDISEDEKAIMRLGKKKTEFEDRLSELVNLLADRKINSEQFNLSNLKTQKEISSIELEIDDIKNRNIKWHEETEKDFNFALHALKEFKNGDNSVKTGILKELSSNLTLINKKLDITTKKSLLEIKKCYSSHKPKIGDSNLLLGL